MPRFMYKIRDAAGAMSSGVLDAASPQAAGVTLRSQGSFVVKIEPAKASSAKARSQPTAGRVKREDVITFAHQLAIMVDTGVPLSEALNCAVEQADNDAQHALFGKIAEHVAAGGELSAALTDHGKVFPQIMISLIKAGEMSGRMGEMLDRASTYLAKEAQTAKKIKGALTYPAVMLLAVLIITVSLLVFVLPRFASIYKAKGAALPVPTQILMSLSSAVTGHWPTLLAGLAAGGLGVFFALRSTAGKRAVDWTKLHAPVVGSLFSKLYITRICRTMGAMLSAGVPILDMVSIARTVTHNVYYQELWDQVDEGLRRGDQLSEAMGDTPLVPRSVGRMIHAGERAGELSKVLAKIAHFMEAEFDEQVKQTTQYIEPLMIAIMGGIVGFVAIALLLPVFNISHVVAS